MPIYTYKAVDKKGKTVKGELDASDELDVSTQLAKLGYFPITIGFKGEKSVSLKEKFFKKSFKPVSSQSLIVFTRQFATIIKAAVPIIEGLGVLAEQTEDENLKATLHQVIHDIEEGARLSEAMAKHPQAFSPLYINTIVAGESGGVLDKVLLRLADVLEEEQSTKEQVKSALQYPTMVICAMFAAVWFMSVAVIPNFTKIYASLKLSLPLPTQIMILISKGFKQYWYITLPALVGMFFLFKFFINTPKGRQLWDGFKFKAPLFGKVYNKIVMLRFSSMFSVLYQAGLPILKILDIVKLSLGNIVISRDMEGIKQDVIDGKGISSGILASKLFPRLVGYMVAVGEKTGALPTMLDSVCDYYNMEVKTAMKNLTGMIEPLMTAVLGVVVLGMALAIFLPMWNMISAMKQAG